jgi:hypothetical protein
VSLYFAGDSWSAATTIANELGRLGVKFFMFQETDNSEDAKVEIAFREIARMTKGAYCRFDAGAPGHLAGLLRAVAAYVEGGARALAAKSMPMLTFFDK